ncbi:MULTISPECIES: tRNA pseudouridine(55) synthase TruB [Peptoniphilus]|uniref:tRNA pseudouridine(55) synthase TruB n=1 Tax=Peptoniphilus TaxID=162289 RepID=UPI0002889E6A|nr:MULTISPECIES: tRNA pseudouridine(55) synthase TruB [Peptoniphilus]MBS6609991.1 tRNA pseudouridine(55) synthase TruB [Peptoniphilus harei]MDU1043518.1 tRNA pseudouridine(55) synthase TruB [Peptoniphilus rhinitidis]MDU1954233.1 tRNA pseudouridine(55) synthase TruB [Peptoniphilus lacydonensis]MDU3751208.1 tRNA pseudouridine(55) synthase TruB [Peptoniphilus rhinitidis]MDU5274591.1 tRNA pseudouridine(55) synthase TruB [Peptoniphilus lacydonensis]
MNGLIIFDKEKGITSHDLVYKVRKKTGIKKVGHAGTLDPMATGVLIIAIGKATKVNEYLLLKDKKYIAKIKLGILTDTFDITGNILEKENVSVLKKDIEEVLKRFTGKMSQTPPIYSALKVNGKKLYEYAREGKEVKIKNRNIEIFENKLIDFNGKDEFSIEIEVSKGTYIRSVAYDIGKAVGTYGTITELRRIKSGNFDIENSIKISDFENMSLDELKSNLIPMELALENLKRIEIPKSFKQNFLNGQFYKLQDKCEIENYRVYCEDLFLGIGEIRIENGSFFLKMKKKLIGDL